MFMLYRSCICPKAVFVWQPARLGHRQAHRSSCTNRLMLYTRLASPILNAARARPIPRMTVIRIDFTWCSKTCSTRARIAERRLLVWCCQSGNAARRRAKDGNGCG